jgi:hypothetical protein
MKILFATLVFLSSLLFSLKAQYNAHDLVISFGANYSKYLSSGEGGNVFDYRNPGFQAELTMNNLKNFEWILYGVQFFKDDNVVGESVVPVKFWIPYYTEFLWYQRDKKNPLFIFFGYDYARMKFEDMEKPDSHHNLTTGCGWNLCLSNKVYLQFKMKPYLVLGNSIGQNTGFNALLNLHLGL